MKKIIISIFGVVLMTSCSSTYQVTASYDVHFPNETKTFESVGTIRANKASGEPKVVMVSFNGSNHIALVSSGVNINGMKDVYGSIYSSTAPIELNSYKVVKVKGSTYTIGDDTYLK